MATALGFPSEDLKEVNFADWMDLVSAAQCPRCGGFMVAEHCFDLLSDSGRLDFMARRCVQCGELIDPVILQNRRLRLLGGLESVSGV
jgi:ribosomal protein S27AE